MKNVLIFDYDGVIVDSFTIFMNYFIQACKEEGVNQITSKKDFLKIFDKNMYESMMKMGMPKDKIRCIVSKVKKGLLENLEKLYFFPGMEETLKSLSEKNILIIITSNDSEVVKQFLRSKHLEIFDEIYGSDTEESKVKKIELIKNEYNGRNIFYIGDTVGDIIEGRQAQVITVGVTWGWHTEQQLQSESPMYLVHSPEELTRIIP